MLYLYRTPIKGMGEVANDIELKSFYDYFRKREFTFIDLKPSKAYPEGLRINFLYPEHKDKVTQLIKKNKNNPQFWKFIKSLHSHASSDLKEGPAMSIEGIIIHGNYRRDV